jgi:hypothetical protein
MANLQDLTMEEFGLLVDAPDLFVPIGTTVTVPVGPDADPVQFTGKINDAVFEYYLKVNSARLTRLTHIINTRMVDGEAQPYNLVTGVLSKVDARLTVVFEGEQISLEQFLCEIVNASVSPDKKVDIDAFSKQLRNMGFRWSSDGMSLLWQHFGASQTKMADAFQAFKAAGAIDATNKIPEERRNRIQTVLEFEKGLPVKSFEIGQADRTRSRTGQGFVDLLESQYDNFRRVIALRTQASKMRADLEAVKDETDPEAYAEIDRSINNLVRQSTRWTTNWGGAQQRKTLQDDGTIEEQDIWDQVSIPCGRISVGVPVFTQMINAETGEPETDPHTGQPLMVRVQEPLLDDDDAPIMSNGKPLMRPAVKEIEIDLWRASGETSEASAMAGEVDTTLGQTGDQSTSNTKIGDDDEF